jgi:hypothetical protein
MIGMVHVGWLFGAAQLAPAAPVISIAPGPEPHELTVSVVGDSGVTSVVQYKGTDDIDWQAGGEVVGSGDIVLTELDNEVPWNISVYAVNGAQFNSVPGVSKIGTLRLGGIV